MKILAVIDMQNDFVDGALGTAEAVRIIPAVKARIEKAAEYGESVLFTRDTHKEDYLNTQEGRKLPVIHCVEGTPGWEIVKELKPYAESNPIFDKPTFGSTELCRLLWRKSHEMPIESVTVIGLCTDICVISNALLFKAFLPETPIRVEAACCAGVTPESHDRALEAMKACQIEVI